MEKITQNKDNTKASTDNKSKYNAKQTPNRDQKGRRPSSVISKQRQARSEFDRQLLSARRVVRVVAGGRRFSLSVAVAIGNRNGQVGIGMGKGLDQASAREKAFNNAKKNIKNIQITKDGSIKKEVSAKYCASMVQIRPAKSGIVSGGAVRMIIDLAGITKVNTKILSRSKNHINNAKATLKALSQL